MTTVEKCPTCGGDAVCRSEFWESVVENSDEKNKQLQRVERAIKKYYLALDNREHGGIATAHAFSEIQSVLGLQWRRGEVSEYLEKHPKLKPFYTE